MEVDGLPIPTGLTALLEAGIWPRTSEAANAFERDRVIPIERVRKLAPEESAIYLNPPPFQRLGPLDPGSGQSFWSIFGAIDEIDPMLAIPIADFGMGADAPILLDYGSCRDNPSVIRLQWSGEQGRIENHWVLCADCFDTFAEILGLNSIQASDCNHRL